MRRVRSIAPIWVAAALSWAIPAAADTGLSEAARMLQEYVRIDTTNPPGRTTEAVAYWREFFESRGIPTDEVPLGEEKSALVARAGEPDAPAVVLMHHMDVVAAEAATWRVPPFSGDVVDGALYGRGTLDTKGLGVLQALATARWAESPVDGAAVVFLAMPDEEVGAVEGAIPFVEHHLDRLGPVSVLLNEGGAGTIGVFGGDRPMMAIQVAEKRALWLRLRASGTAGHGSAPHDDMAVATLARALARVADREPEASLPPVVAEMLRRRAGLETGLRRWLLRRPTAFWARGLVLRGMEQVPQSRALTRNTCSLTGLEAGQKVNVLPESATALLDCRLLPGTTTPSFLADLSRVIDDDRVEIVIDTELEPAPPTPWRSAAFAAMEATVLEHLPDAVVTPTMSAGFTDSSHFRRAGVASYGFFPVVLRKDEIGGVHGRDERVRLDELDRADRIYTAAVRRLTDPGAEAGR